MLLNHQQIPVLKPELPPTSGAPVQGEGRPRGRHAGAHLPPNLEVGVGPAAGEARAVAEPPQHIADVLFGVELAPGEEGRRAGCG